MHAVSAARGSFTTYAAAAAVPLPSVYGLDVCDAFAPLLGAAIQH